MKKIYSNVYKPYLANLKKAKKIIENNAVIGLPTETVYGLAGNAYSNESIKKIFSLKRRPVINPVIIHFRDLKDLKNDVVLNDSFMKLYRAFCPGPITFILKKKDVSKISKKATAGKNTVAVRIPKHRIARKLLKICQFRRPSALAVVRLPFVSKALAWRLVRPFGRTTSFSLFSLESLIL